MISRRFPLVLLLLCLLQTLAPNAPSVKMRVHFIDVGQADATLLEFSCGAVLIDTGGEAFAVLDDDDQVEDIYSGSDALIGYLQGFFDARPQLGRRLDLLVLTHPHIDHTRGVRAVVRQFRPRKIVDNGQTEGSGWLGQAEAASFASANEDVDRWYVLSRTVPNGEGLSNETIDPLDCEGKDPVFRVLWGQARSDASWNQQEFRDANNHSVVLRVDYGESSILFTGDLEESFEGKQAGIEHLLAKHGTSGLLDVDVYQVGHHGSHNGTTEALARAMSPQIVVLSHGPACPRFGFTAWSYGHPRTDTIRELAPHVSKSRKTKKAQVYDGAAKEWKTWSIDQAIYSTGWDGTIVLEATSSGQWSVASLSGPHECLDRE